jgi:predicted DCC family thiol-disulfide oxidoreductase YuxK
MDGELFTVLIDGECPVCRREAEFLRRLDGGRKRLALEDISAPGFDPSRFGCSMDELKEEIHGALADGTVVRGMEVFRRAYAAVGLGWLLVPTRLPVVRQAADVAYRWMAHNRFRWMGRVGACPTGRCRVPRSR